jgi:hypothetical protein
LLEVTDLRPDLDWDSITPTEFEDDVEGSGEDLLRRLRDERTDPPVLSTFRLLGLASAGRNSAIASGGQGALPRPFEVRSLIGPNIVVVYEPGSVEDLALLWNLRAAHGLPRGLPLAVPTTEDVPQVLEAWTAQHAQAHFGLGGDRRWCLTSHSVSADDLQHIVGETNASAWRALDPQEVSTVVAGPARHTTALLTFENGRAQAALWTDRDREELGARGSLTRQPQMVGNIALQTRHIPRLESLLPAYTFEPAYRNGGFGAPAGSSTDITPVRWPAGWTVLAAAFHDRGLRIEPSLPGKTAAALLRRLGSIGDVVPLLDVQLLDLLQRLAERRGMSWFRARARELGSLVGEKDPDAAVRIEAVLRDLALRPFEDEQHDITCSQLQQALGNDRAIAKEWLAWAEDRGVLVRGARLGCDRCGAVLWGPLRDIAPPVACRGCGQPIERPFSENGLEFHYRASETLLRAVDGDAVSHILAMRWFCEFFAERFGRPAPLYGGYPGVDLYDRETDEHLGEADVALLQADGEIVLGECKRSGAGLREGDLTKLDDLAERAACPWTFIATPDWTAGCPSLWQEAVRYAPDPKPRVALTGEQLFQDAVFNPLGVDPFAWAPTDDLEQEALHVRFTERLGDQLAWLTGRYDPDSQLLEVETPP